MQKKLPQGFGSTTDDAQPLAGQVVLVTGGARRLGRAICETLWQQGASIVIHYHRSMADAQALASQLGSRARIVQADLRDRAATENMFASVLAECLRIDAVVCNAAAFVRTPIETLDDAAWDDLIAVNLTAPRRCLQLGIAAGAKVIVNVADVGATQAWRGFAAYGVSKTGLLQLTKIAAKELIGRMRVNAVLPGFVLPPDDASEDELARLSAKWAGYPAGSPLDVARAVAFLLREPFLTGVCLPVDGGQSL